VVLGITETRVKVGLDEMRLGVRTNYTKQQSEHLGAYKEVLSKIVYMVNEHGRSLSKADGEG